MKEKILQQNMKRDGKEKWKNTQKEGEKKQKEEGRSGKNISKNRNKIAEQKAVMEKGLKYAEICRG